PGSVEVGSQGFPHDRRPPLLRDVRRSTSLHIERYTRRLLDHYLNGSKSGRQQAHSWRWSTSCGLGLTSGTTTSPHRGLRHAGGDWSGFCRNEQNVERNRVPNGPSGSQPLPKVPHSALAPTQPTCDDRPVASRPLLIPLFRHPAPQWLAVDPFQDA